MPLINTHELTGSALDWAVAKALGLLEPEEYLGRTITRVVLDPGWWAEDGKPMVRLNPAPPVYYNPEYSPSTRWDQGGPLIEQQEISIEFGRADFKLPWIAYKLGLPDEDNPAGGLTALIAACRCLVFHKLGTQVDIPQELL